MGVRGLTRFLSDYERNLFKKLELKDDKIIIDGFGLAYYLYFDIGLLDSSLGGEYQQFYNIINEFFLALKSCGINAFVVLDGCVQQEKAQCINLRNQERINRIKKLFAGKLNDKFRVLPQLAIFILKQVMRKNNIPYRVSTIDADAETVACANHFSCPVVAQDSDYLIFDVTGGYIPFSTMEWRNVSTAQHKAISCKKYHTDGMRLLFGLKSSALPFLSIFVGNDWINADNATLMFTKFAKTKKTRPGTSRILQRINWLKGSFTKMPTFLQFVQNMASKQEFATIKLCLQMYTEIPDICTKKFVIGNSQVDLGSHTLQQLIELDIAPPYTQDLLNLSKVYLPVVPFDVKLLSPYVASENIRHLIYTFALIKCEIMEKKVKEFDVINQNYTPSTLKITPSCDECGNEKTCRIFETLSNKNRLQFLKHIDPIFAESFNSEQFGDNVLIVLSICIWKKFVGPSTLQIVAVVLLLNLDGKNCILKRLEQDQICPRSAKMEEIDKDLLQKSAELQSIFMALFELNTLCGQILPAPTKLILQSNFGLKIITEHLITNFQHATYEEISINLLQEERPATVKDFKEIMTIVST